MIKVGLQVAVCLTALFFLTGAARGADLDEAKGLLKTGNCAAALSALGEIVSENPEDSEARLLMATCFAERDVDLQMPGNIVVGRSNLERATCQLGILGKLGDQGKKLLLSAFDGPSEKLSNLVMQIARRDKIADAAGPLANVIERANAPAAHVSAAILALAEIAGDKVAEPIVKVLRRETVDSGTLQVALDTLARYPTPAAGEPIRKLAEKETNEDRKSWIVGHYLMFLSGDERVALAKNTNDPTVLQILSTHQLDAKSCLARGVTHGSGRAGESRGGNLLRR